jgi:hypothetical protein
MKSRSIYEISSEMKMLLENEELTPELEARLAAVDIDFNDKMESYLQHHQNLIRHGEGVVSEIKRLQKLRDEIAKDAERVKGIVERQMKEFGMGKFYGTVFTGTICKSPPKVHISDDAELPDSFMRTKTIREPNKEALLECAKLGFALPPGVSVTSTPHLRIS